MQLKLHPYSKKFLVLFKKEKAMIEKSFSGLSDFQIDHVGSTSVVNLGGKGIVDILIGIKDWKQKNKYIKALKKIGFKYAVAEEKGRIFIHKVRGTKKGDIHIHLVKIGSKEQKDHLAFRNLLRKSKKERERYWKLKKEWLKTAEGDRERFGELKAPYIKNLISK